MNEKSFIPYIEHLAFQGKTPHKVLLTKLKSEINPLLSEEAQLLVNPM